jgi:hypothetical protein
MTNEITANEIYWCRACETETETTNRTCLQCGNKMEKQSFIRLLGKLSLGVSVLITLIAASVFLGAAAIFLFSETMSNDITTAFLVRCGMAIMVGITSIIGTAKQAKTGRTSKVFLFTLLGIIFVSLLLGSLFSF